MRLFLIFLLFNVKIWAQSDFGIEFKPESIRLVTLIPNEIGTLTPQAASYLENKLKQIVLKNNLVGEYGKDRFILTANVDVISKFITGTAPPMFSYELEVSFYVGDGLENILLNSISLVSKGVGKSEEEAISNAIKNIKTSNSKIIEFLNSSQARIIDYYDKICAKTIKEAQLLAGRKEFDEALYLLFEIPSYSENCYFMAMEEVATIHKSKLDHECRKKITNAEVLIAQQRWEEASEELKLVEPDLVCYKDAMNLISRIQKHASDNSKRAIAYKENQEFELEKRRIDQAKAVGEAFGKNQPKTVINNYNYKGFW